MTLARAGAAAAAARSVGTEDFGGSTNAVDECAESAGAGEEREETGRVSREAASPTREKREIEENMTMEIRLSVSRWR